MQECRLSRGSSHSVSFPDCFSLLCIRLSLFGHLDIYIISHFQRLILVMKSFRFFQLKFCSMCGEVGLLRIHGETESRRDERNECKHSSTKETLMFKN